MSARKKILILGKNNSVFIIQTAKDFHAFGYHVTVLGDKYSRRFIDPPIEIFDQTKVKISFVEKVCSLFIAEVINLVDVLSVLLYSTLNLGEYSWKNFKGAPNLKRNIYFRKILRAELKISSYDVIYCHHVFFYSLSKLSLPSSTKLIIHPWGSDINRYSVLSPFRQTFIKRTLQACDVILVGSISARKFIARTFSVGTDKIHTVNYTVPRNEFYRLNDIEQTEIKTKYGVPSEKIIVFSCRRFAPGWGPDIIKRAFINYAETDKNLFFIVLSGFDSNEMIDRFEQDVVEKGLIENFLFVKREIALSEYAKLSQMSNYIVSAMTNPDMRSSSILQAVACGCFPILSSQREYDQMVQEGFTYMSFDGSDEDLLAKLKSIRGIPSPEIIESNSGYIDSLNDTKYVSKIDSLVGD